MNPIVVYSSPTGLTQQIAETVVKALPDQTLCLSVEQVPQNIGEYDCVFLGFCMSHGVADDASQQVFKKLRPGQHVGVFITVKEDLYSDDASKGLHDVIELLPPGLHVDGTYITSIEKYMVMTAEEHQEHMRFVSDFATNTYKRMQA
ncbi:MAG: flavodoxin family protein [Megasphaera sp.]|nr:flavodoxin family protein [Megasphaera sp.]MCH4187308.1 flavodoxin family protein [Megasphaera sp.]MCH4217274.1 flavodoxin family protein [Megasphaera sp.]